MVRALERLSRFYYVGVLRPVHALPRGHRLAGPHAQAHHRRPGAQRGSRACCSTSPTASRATRSARSAMRRPGRCRASSSTSGHEFEYMIEHKGRSIVDGRRRRRRRKGAAMSDDLVNIEVNGVPLKARKGQMIMQVTDAGGHLHPALLLSRRSSASPPTAACAWSRSRRRRSRCRPARRR